MSCWVTKPTSANDSVFKMSPYSVGVIECQLLALKQTPQTRLFFKKLENTKEKKKQSTLASFKNENWLFFKYKHGGSIPQVFELSQNFNCIIVSLSAKRIRQRFISWSALFSRKLTQMFSHTQKTWRWRRYIHNWNTNTTLTLQTVYERCIPMIAKSPHTMVPQGVPFVMMKRGVSESPK